MFIYKRKTLDDKGKLYTEYLTYDINKPHSKRCGVTTDINKAYRIQQDKRNIFDMKNSLTNQNFVKMEVEE